jgi:glycosyltransferase involved in cell wall biosynthesis
MLCLEHLLSRRAALRADEVIVKSREMADALSPIDCHVIPNGVDMDAFRPMSQTAARAKLGWKQGEPLILFGGNPADMNKNHRLARESVALASERLGKAIRLIPLKGFSPEAVPAVMNACNGMILTSHREGSPNVVKECLACNRPVVSVRAGDVESVIGSIDGCHLRDYSPEELAGGLCSILEQPREIRGRGALREKGLDMGTTAERILGVYCRAMGVSSEGEIQNH